MPIPFLARISFQEKYSPLVFKNIRVFDGEKVLEETSVVVESGKIAAVGRGVPLPAEAKIVDGRGKTLLPGLIDAHVHVTTPGALEQASIFGVTTVIDMFMDVRLMQEIKKRQDGGEISHQAYLVSAGTLATAPGGHGTQYGLDIPTLSSPEECPNFVEARLAEGSDFLKIIYDDGRAYGQKRPTLNLPIIEGLIRAAHKKGKLVVVHAATLENCLDVLRAGADGLAHLYFNADFDPGFGKICRQKKAFVIPTLTTLDRVTGFSKRSRLKNDPDISPYLSTQDELFLEAIFPFDAPPERVQELHGIRQKVLKQLKDNRVPILAGTDAPNPGTTYGASLHEELELLVEAGLTPAEALKAATSLPADKFHLAGRGRIRPGARADLVLVEGNPAEDIKASRRILGVWLGGLEVDREKYRLTKKEEREKIGQLKKIAPAKEAESGWISDFDGDKITASFGSGWIVSTDVYMGGKSKAKMELVQYGAEESRGSLLITGEIIEGSQFRWAGVAFYPGATVMAPANLSFKEAISFWAKGKERTYAVLIFSQSRGFIPAIQTFKAGAEWQEFVFPFKKFGLDGHDITLIFIGAYGETGPFSIQIDNVRLK